MNWLSKYLYEPNLLVPLRKPIGLVEIDWDNALTKGLVGCWIFDKGSGSAVPGVVRNLAKRTSNPQNIYAGTGISTVQTSYGLAVTNDLTTGNNGYYVMDLTQDDFPDYNATLMEFLQTSSVNQGYHRLNVTQRSHYVFSGTNYNASFRSDRINVAADTDLIKNPHYHSIVQDFSNDSYKSFYKLPGANEKPLLSDTSGSTWVLGTPELLGTSEGWFLTYDLSSRYWFCYIWNRALGSSEREEIYRSPYVILKPANNAPFLFLLTGGGISLGIQSAAHSQLADNVALTQANVLAVDATAHAHTSDNLVLTAASPLDIDGADHIHASDILDLVQANALAISETAHAHTADALTLDVSLVLDISDAAHAQLADNPDLLQANVLAILDAAHAHTADNPGLITASTLIISDALHQQLSDNLDLIIGGAAIPATGDILVLAEDRSILVLAEDCSIIVASERQVITVH